MISRSRRSLFKDQSFGGSDNAGINTSNSEWACKGRELGGGKGRHTGVGVKCLWWGEGVEGVVMMYGACEIVRSEYVFSS